MRATWFITLLALLTVNAAHAEAQLDFAAIAKDVEMLKKVDHRLTMVMWMPEQYWRASLQSNDRLTDKAKDEFYETMRPYLLVAVLEANVGLAGAVSYSSADTLKEIVRVEDGAATPTHRSIPKR